MATTLIRTNSLVDARQTQADYEALGYRVEVNVNRGAGHLFIVAVEKVVDAWEPACGGTEQPFTARSGARLLYCYNSALQRHAYVNLDTDMVLTDEEARAHLQTY